jgi:predicted AlkP superfamily phosphohydrolase/phosphomutase
LAPEDFVEGAGVLAVPVADKEARTLIDELEAEVARLLGHSGASWVGGAASEPDTAAAVRDEEQRVVAAQQHALDGKEIAGDDSGCLRPQKRAPARAVAPGRRLQFGLSEQPAMLVGEARKPSLASSPQIRR